MPVFRLSKEIAFPDPALAEPEGLLAVGGDLSPERLLAAYAAGIFPWFSEGDPILWWSTDPRLILLPAELKIRRSLAKVIRQNRFEIRTDTAFEQVINRCAAKSRSGQPGTWITPDMRAAYIELHRLGFAHSIEAWQDDQLCGGLYGLSLGETFFGESMYSDVPNASKVAFVRLIEATVTWGFDLIDCQTETEHLMTFGARSIPRCEYLERLERSVSRPTRRGLWSFS